jgi:hypothetical protein
MPDEPITDPPPAPSADTPPPDPQPDTRIQKRFSELTARLHTLEGERDTYRTQLEASRRRVAERAAAAVLAEPSDLWSIGGASVDELLTDDGDIDPAKVKQKAEDLVKQRPRLAGVPAPRPLPGPGGQPPQPIGGGPQQPATLRSVLERRQLRPPDVPE